MYNLSKTINELICQLNRHFHIKNYHDINVAIKVNFSGLPYFNSPKTDITILYHLVSFLISKGCTVSIIECAGGHLKNNLQKAGFSVPNVNVLDLDLESEIVHYCYNGKNFTLPRVLETFDLRMALPTTTKRVGYIFSSNVKSFIGLLPSIYCQDGSNKEFTRPSIHDDLHGVVSALYATVQTTTPFTLFVNGGNSVIEGTKINALPLYYWGDDGAELDLHLVNEIGLEVPGYLHNIFPDL